MAAWIGFVEGKLRFPQMAQIASKATQMETHLSADNGVIEYRGHHCTLDNVGEPKWTILARQGRVARR